MTWELRLGDCLDPLTGLASLATGSADAVITDPPAGISFMGAAWDADRGGRGQWVDWMTGVMRQALRVLKPGAHAIVWALPRTSHWTATALEDAGFEVRDVITHHFGSGFPKSLDVSKAIDRAAGAEREVTGPPPYRRGKARQKYSDTRKVSYDYQPQPLTAPATAAAKQWVGWGTALKPASEHWILARKPLVGTVAANVRTHGTGALNIDECRVGGDKSPGRWPANLVLSHAEECGDACHVSCPIREMDTGARFFYCAKPSRSERGDDNTHPTVKSVALMSYLIRLVTPAGGLVVDPFAGSGTTGVAAMKEERRFIGWERQAEYEAIAVRRISSMMVIEPDDK